MTPAERKIRSAMQRQMGVKTYDPQTYDPQNYDAGAGYASQPSPIGQFTITVVSSAFGAAENYILFNGFQPLEIFNNQGIVPSAATTFTVASNGDLVYTKGGNTVTIHGQNFPYYSLVKSSVVKPFHIYLIRFSSLTQAQQSNTITFLRDQNFLGKSTQNQVNPKDYVIPDQFQNLIVDINNLNETINGEWAMWSTINNTESLSLTFFVDKWSDANMNTKSNPNK